MGRENGYQVGILSKLMQQYSQSSQSNSVPLSPQWVSGFTDAEGSFMIKLSRVVEGLGYKVQLEFSIGLHSKDVSILNAIKQFFGVGTVRVSGNTAFYSVRSLGDIISVIIPHFVSYPLLTCKWADFLLFKAAALLLKAKLHLTVEGLQQVVNIRASINNGLTPDLNAAFPNTIPAGRPVYPLGTIVGDWLAGFVSGDGGFGVTVFNELGTSLSRVVMVFYLTQHVRDLELMKAIQAFLGCGSISPDGTTVTLSARGQDDIRNIIIPFFTTHPVVGVKHLDFIDWVRISRVMADKGHLTAKGVAEISRIKGNMNRSRRF